LAGHVLSNIFAEEESYDDGDSERYNDVWGYLGPSTLPRVELEEEACDLIGHSQDSNSNKLAGKSVASNLTSNSEEHHEEGIEDTRSDDEDPPHRSLQYGRVHQPQKRA